MADKKGILIMVVIIVVVAALIGGIMFYISKVWGLPLLESSLLEKTGGSYLQLGPGGCNNQEECTQYCFANAQECIQWCEEKAALCPDYLKKNMELLQQLK